MEQTTTRQAVASEVRAWAGRRQVSGRELARRTGISYATLARRTSGELPFTVDELVQVAEALDVPVSDLFGSPHRDSAGSPIVTDRDERELVGAF